VNLNTSIHYQRDSTARTHAEALHRGWTGWIYLLLLLCEIVNRCALPGIHR